LSQTLRFEPFANKIGIIALSVLSISTQFLVGANSTATIHDSLTVVPSSELANSLSLSSTSRPPSVFATAFDRLSPDATTTSYTNRLDFISVIVICSIIALCFIVCIIVGCRRKKHRLPTEELVTSRSYSGRLDDVWFFFKFIFRRHRQG